MTASVDLVPHWQIGDVVLTSYPFGVDAESTVDVGEPEMVVETVPSQMADGDSERVVRHGNRRYRLEFYIEGPTLGELAASEALLRAELRRPLIPLLHDPGDALSPASVYEVQTAQLTPQRRDDHESHLIRKFILTLTCSPWARSADAVTVDALVIPGSATTVTINDASSATGWSAMGYDGSGITTPAVVASGGSLTITGPQLFSLTVVNSAGVDFSATKYLIAEVEFSGGTLTAQTNGDSEPLRVARGLPSGRMQMVWEVTSPPSWGVQFDVSGPKSDKTLVIHDVSRSDTIPQVSPRQMTRIVEVGGTERTPASIHVRTASGTGSLGQCIVHTAPEDGSGYSPPLQRWRTVGQTRTTDATAFSGTYESINTTSWIAEVPTSALPEGGYVLVARLRAQSAATVTVTWSTSTIFPDAVTQEGFTVGTVQHTFAAGNVWELVKMDALTLPSVRTKSGKVQIALQVAAASPVVTLDEAWLFREDDDCALTIVETARPHLWLDSPDLTSPVPRTWVGDGSMTKVHPGTGLKAQAAHVLSPEGTAVFTAALTDNPSTDATFFRRWHSNAAS